MSIRTLARIAAPAIATAAVLLVADAAAASTTLPLHDAHRNTTAAGFSTHSCDQIPAALQGGSSDGFVFVLPANDANFVSLSLSFRNTAGTTVTIAVPDPADAYPDGITTNGTSKAWVVVPAGWTLLDGTAVVDNAATKADDFNLTHTCVGTPASPSVSPSPSRSASPSSSAGSSASPSLSPSHTVEGSSQPPTTPAPSGSLATPGGAGGASGGGSSLPVTGVAVTTTAVTGAALIAAGFVLMNVRRRRLHPAFVADADAAGTPDADGETPGER